MQLSQSAKWPQGLATCVRCSSRQTTHRSSSGRGPMVFGTLERLGSLPVVGHSTLANCRDDATFKIWPFRPITMFRSAAFRSIASAADLVGNGAAFNWLEGVVGRVEEDRTGARIN